MSHKAPVSLRSSAEVVQARQLPEGHYTRSLRGFRVSPARLVLKPNQRALPWNMLVQPVRPLKGSPVSKTARSLLPDFSPTSLSLIKF